MVSNRNNLIFKVDMQPSFFARTYIHKLAGLILSITNYAISSNINPIKQVRFLEDGNTLLYPNILVLCHGNATVPKLLKLLRYKRKKL